MILLFGQFPKSAVVVGQFALHSIVGSIGDPVTPPVNPPSSGGGGGGSSYIETYIRRDSIKSKPPVHDDDLLAAITVFMTLETNLPQ